MTYALTPRSHSARARCGATNAKIECPKHGSAFSLLTGEPATLPATQPVPVFGAAVVDGQVVVTVTIDTDANENDENDQNENDQNENDQNENDQNERGGS